MRYQQFILAVFFIALTSTSCKTLTAYTNAFKCDFRMESLSNTSLAGIDVQKIKGVSDLNFIQAGRLTSAYLGGDVPLSFQVNIEAKNPNAAEAKLAKFDWILMIDDVQITTGTNTQEYHLPGNGNQMIPLTLSINLLDVLNNESKNALLNFGFNLADAGGKPTRVGLKIKPSINLNGFPIAYPGYIDLGTEFGGTE